MKKVAGAGHGVVLLASALLLGGCARVTGVHPGPGPGPAGDPAPSERPVEPPPATAGTPAPASSREVRALWVVRTTLTHPDSIRAMVARASDSGFNTLLVQVRGRGDALYLGGPEPRSPLLARQPGDFDPLALVLEESRRRGLEVHAWVNTHLVSSAVTLPTDPGHLVNAHPEWLAVPRELARRLHGMDPGDRRYVDALAAHARENRSRLEGLYSSPVHPGVAEHVLEVWRHLLTRYDLDGVHLDYMRFAAPDFDHSRSALSLFRNEMATRIPPARRDALDAGARGDPLTWVDAFPSEWVAFREAGVSALVERVATEARRLRPDVRITAAVFPGLDSARRDRFQDWGTWVERGWVDAVAPMSYTANPATYREQIRDAVRTAGGGRVWAGLGVYQTTFQGALGHASIAREEGAAGLALFSYDWAVADGWRVAGGSYLDLFSRQLFPGAAETTGR
jgi:uncharacterized lipoprotein YddW (UPF0748 family)